MLRVVYAQPHYSEICLCDAPIGTSLFWTAKKALPWNDGKVHGRWRLGEPVGKSAWTRIVPFCNEVPERKLGTAIRDAHARLPRIRQTSGTLGVILKRYGKERSRRELFPLDPDDVLTVGFFHVPEITNLNWNDFLAIFAQEPPKPGLPTTLKPVKPAAPPANHLRWRGP